MSFVHRLLTAIVIAAGPAALPGSPQQPPAPPPHIPICTGLTLVTAVNSGGGDYESIKTLEAVDENQVTLRYSTQKMDYGGLFDTHPPKLRSYEFKRIIQRQDLKTSRAYLQEFSEMIPEVVSGMTAFGTSATVLNELKAKGQAEFGISHWAFPAPMTNDPSATDYGSIQKKQMRTTSKVVDRGTLPVLVNGHLVQLPFVHTRGDFLSYISEFWFLDQPDNPITLKFRIGIGEIKPIDQATRENCQVWLKHAGYAQQHCLKPDGGDSSVLELVKINYRCGAATTLAGGSGSGTGSGNLPAGGGGLGAGTAAGAGRGTAGGAGTGTGSGPAGTGAATGSGGAGGSGAGTGGGSGSGGGASGTPTGAGGAAEIESALAKESRVEIFDIFFSFDSDEIRTESEPRLSDIAAVLKRHADWKLQVEGHTDSLAADDYNLKLSQRRAAAVTNALVRRYGIDAARLVPKGLGETKPRASNDSLAGRARNRRVELVRMSP